MTPSIESNTVQRAGGGSFLSRLPTIREMLGSLETLTNTGRQHLMTKVVAFIRDQGQDAVRNAGGRDQRLAIALLDGLVVESSRPLPDVHEFAHRAESLVDLLSATA
jgi:hypothetical protein